MPQPYEESQSPPLIVSERDTRLLNAFLATMAVAVVNDISAGAGDDDPSEDERLNPELIAVAFELMGMAGCAKDCTEPGCQRTARINGWMAEAVAHVDRGEALGAHEEFDAFVADFMAEDPEDAPPPALLN